MKARGSAKRVWVRLARNRRSPKRPSEPRPSGVHSKEVIVGKGGRSLPFGIAGGVRDELMKRELLKRGAGAETRIAGMVELVGGSFP